MSLRTDPVLRAPPNADWEPLTSVLEQLTPADAIRWSSFPTPFGEMYAAVTFRGLARLSWDLPSEDDFVADLEARFAGWPVIQDRDGLADVERELSEYFAGARDRFDLPVDLTDLRPFQRGVLEAARSVPFGQVVPYAELARRIRKPKASRAVGNALGGNPVAIIVPCHRIVRSDGALGGYTGGVQYKKRLLALEGREDLLRAG